jgi:hypothetical protein
VSGIVVTTVLTFLGRVTLRPTMSVMVMFSFSGSGVAVGLGRDSVVVGDGVNEELGVVVGCVDVLGVAVAEVDGDGEVFGSDAGAKRLSANAPPEIITIAINAMLTYLRICLFLFEDIH